MINIKLWYIFLCVLFSWDFSCRHWQAWPPIVRGMCTQGVVVSEGGWQLLAGRKIRFDHIIWHQFIIVFTLFSESAILCISQIKLTPAQQGDGGVYFVSPSISCDYGYRKPCLFQLGTDFEITAPSAKLANLLLESGVSTWSYLFTHPFNNRNYTNWRKKHELGKAHHQFELIFLFGADGYQYTEDEKALSAAMLTWWTNFAKYGWGKYFHQSHECERCRNVKLTSP